MRSLFNYLGISTITFATILTAAPDQNRYIALVVNESDIDLFLQNTLPNTTTISLKRGGEVINPFNYNISERPLGINQVRNENEPFKSSFVVGIDQKKPNQIFVQKNIPDANPILTTYDLPKNDHHFAITIKKDFSLKIEPVFYLKNIRNNANVPYELSSINPTTISHGPTSQSFGGGMPPSGCRALGGKNVYGDDERRPIDCVRTDPGFFITGTEKNQKNIQAKTTQGVNGHLTVGVLKIINATNREEVHSVLIDGNNKLQIDGNVIEKVTIDGKKVEIKPGAFTIVISNKNILSVEPVS